MELCLLGPAETSTPTAQIKHAVRRIQRRFKAFGPRSFNPWEQKLLKEIFKRLICTVTLHKISGTDLKEVDRIIHMTVYS